MEITSCLDSNLKVFVVQRSSTIFGFYKTNEYLICDLSIRHKIKCSYLYFKISCFSTNISNNFIMNSTNVDVSTGSLLLRELKKLDDKQLLVEVQLTESRTYHALGNLQKSKAALTSARTTANSMYCPPKMQASLDQQSGILNAAEEKDWKTAYSYFYEAFEGYDSIENKKAVSSLKYMLLCKIMLNAPDDVQALLSGKLALKYTGPEVRMLVILVDFRGSVNKQ